MRTLDLHSPSPSLDFGDAVAVAHMEDRDIVGVFSYDGHFDHADSVLRVEPQAEDTG